MRPGRVVINFPILDHGPLEALDVERNSRHGGEDNDGLETHLFTLVVLGLGGPGEEVGDVLGHLRGGGGGAWGVSGVSGARAKGKGAGMAGMADIVS